MDTVDLKPAIRAIEAEIQRLQKRLERLRKADSILCEGEDRPNVNRDAGGKSHPRMAQEILLDFGSPMHVTDLIRAMKTKFGRDVDAASLSTALYKRANDKKIFYKSEEAGNTYGLRAWLEDSEQEKTQ